VERSKPQTIITTVPEKESKKGGEGTLMIILVYNGVKESSRHAKPPLSHIK
jgi:hypothetical protein